jgi:hypothetical protein
MHVLRQALVTIFFIYVASSLPLSQLR